MAKNIKWIQVDAGTQVSVAIAKPREGALNLGYDCMQAIKM